jgi:hypothetical protein
MAITTSIAPSYGWRMLFIAVLCAVFGVWGIYDYIKIPEQEAKYAAFESAKATLAEIAERQVKSPGQPLSRDDEDAFKAATLELTRLAPAGEPPGKPGKWDRLTCWFFIACLPCAPYFMWLYLKAKRQAYRLDDEGTLHFTGDPQRGSGAWASSEIADIDMNRWMAKSIAYVIHSGDGARLKLDAYLHKNLHLVVGAIASRLHPDRWDAEAKPVKKDQDVANGAAQAEVAADEKAA